MNNDPLKVIENASNIPEVFWHYVTNSPDCSVYSYPKKESGPGRPRSWHNVNYADAGAHVARLSRYLEQLGVRPGERIAIISNTRPEWCFADLAILSLGAVTVSIYQSLTPHDAGYILFDSLSKIAFVENQEQLDKLLLLLAAPCPIPAKEDQPAGNVQITIERIIAFEEVTPHPIVTQLSSILSDEKISSAPMSIQSKPSRDSLASLVYTSGTTGPPKGVAQTHGNHLANVHQTTSSGVFPLDGSLFLFLPLAHSFARLAYYIGFLTSVNLKFSSVADSKTSRTDLAAVSIDLRESGSSVIPSVPRLFEKMAAAIRARSESKGLQSFILSTTLKAAEKYYHAKHNGGHSGIWDQILYQGTSPIRLKIKAQLFGNNFSHAISGGAKLDLEVCKFFDSLEIKICEGYGLTETCVATHVNLPNKRRIGSVGPALPGVQTKISPEDGEILLSGPNVTKEYWNRPQATADSFQSDGWFHTGDIGKIDEDGFLYITDRKKDLIVTAGGKKIPPASIESRFQKSAYISHLVVYGDGKPYCVALVTLNPFEIKQWLSHKHPTLIGSEKIHELTEVNALVKEEIHAVNESLASFESIKRFTILDQEFSIENGLLTPTLKVKRKQVIETFRDKIEDLYKLD